MKNNYVWKAAAAAVALLCSVEGASAEKVLKLGTTGR